MPNLGTWSIQTPQKSPQSEVNDWLKDLSLPDTTHLRHKAKNLLSARTSFCWYRSREKEFALYFADTSGLVIALRAAARDWKLFVALSRISLKFIILNNRSKLAFLQIAYSVHRKNHKLLGKKPNMKNINGTLWRFKIY